MMVLCILNWIHANISSVSIGKEHLARLRDAYIFCMGLWAYFMFSIYKGCTLGQKSEVKNRPSMIIEIISEYKDPKYQKK